MLSTSISLLFICSCVFILPPFSVFVHAQTFDIKIMTESVMMISPSSTITNPESPLVLPSPGQVFYVVVGIGTPPSPTKVAFDTTSPVTWVQVPQCRECFPFLKGKGTTMFNPKNSSTFQALRSKDPICARPFAIPSSRGSCQYDLGYTRGLLARDRFRLTTLSSSPFVFGCGLYNRILIGGARTDNPISGILGLGTGHPSSLFSQLQSVTRGRFSYCLPAHYHPVNGSRAPTLDFGPQAVISGDGVQTTPLLKVPGNLFSLNVTRISLNGKLVVDLLRLARAPSERGGSFVLDSITPNTLMKQQDYHGLSQAVVSYFKLRYGWEPLEQSMSGYDLCYALARGDVIYPIITRTAHAGRGQV